MRAKHSERIIKYVLDNYATMPTKHIAILLGLTCSAVYQIANLRGIKKDKQYKREYHGNRLMQAGIPTRFKAGQRAWNKGMKKNSGIEINTPKNTPL
jgi:hypothetical protein